MSYQQTLQEIGRQLDNNIYPFINNGGIVTPNDSTVPINMGEEKCYERTRRSETRPWHGTTRRQGPSDQAPSLISPGIQTLYESELDAVQQAYPKTRVWHKPDGLLLLTESKLLADLPRTAMFVVAVPYTLNPFVKGWGFWAGSISMDWIGPRHTNFPDGSICAFDPSDKTWAKGDPLVQLLDLYSLWALRHLHLEKFGRWPGYQAIQFPYERVLELHADEFCGCKHSDNLYGECCQKHDQNRNLVRDAVDFVVQCNGGHRAPPKKILKIVTKGIHPDSISEFFSL